jgi:hypothetical protein
MTFIFRVVGWFMLVGGALMAVLSFAATEDRAIAIGAAVATTLVGLALIKSKPLILENMLGFDMLGREKTSELRQNSRKAAPNSALQRTEDP